MSLHHNHRRGVRLAESYCVDAEYVVECLAQPMVYIPVPSKRRSKGLIGRYLLELRICESGSKNSFSGFWNGVEIHDGKVKQGGKRSFHRHVLNKLRIGDKDVASVLISVA